MIRVTTNGTLRSYKSSLMRASNNLNSARETVLTQRSFNSYAEDPAAATQAFKLRRSYSRTSDQLSNTNSLIKKYQSAWDALNTVKSDLTEQEGKVSALKGVSGATAAGRQPLAEVLRGAAESIVQTMNSQYGSAFLFAGNDSLGGAPFALETDADGNEFLTYRGVAVDATDADGNVDSTALQALDAMNEEASYVDVGAGLTEQGGALVSSSAFNAAISGIECLGYGVDGDGDPQNVVSILLRLSDIFSACDADSGDFASEQDEEDATRLTGKLQDALDSLTNQWTQLDGRSSYLESNATRLTSMSDDLNEQILDIEQADLANAITEFSWAQYCYNAALKAGNSILSGSLMDYMN